MILSPLAAGFALRSPPAVPVHTSCHAAIDARGGAVRMHTSDGGPVHVRVVDGFLEGSADDEGSALDLRSTFDERFAEEAARRPHAAGLVAFEQRHSGFAEHSAGRSITRIVAALDRVMHPLPVGPFADEDEVVEPVLALLGARVQSDRLPDR